jgi:hypothetical protein
MPINSIQNKITDVMQEVMRDSNQSSYDKELIAAKSLINYAASFQGVKIDDEELLCPLLPLGCRLAVDTDVFWSIIRV